MRLRQANSALITGLLSLTLALCVQNATFAQERERTEQNAQGSATSQQSGDSEAVNSPGQHVCENSHAPTGNPDLTDREESLSPPPGAARGEAAEADTRTQIARAGDDCLDPQTSDNDDARGQGTGSNPDTQGGSQIRDPQG